MRHMKWIGALILGGALLGAACHGHAEVPKGDPQNAAQARQPRFTIDTPVRLLVRNARAKAIIDRYVPGITEGPHLGMAAPFSLRQLKPMMHGQITDAELAQMDTELRAIR